ncbi:MAG: zinc ribbon domain-containing protein [Dehalococcoidia bacterium]
MPVYEFSCNNCNAPLSVFVRSVNSPVNAVCERCGSGDVRRLVSKFAVLRGPGARIDDLSGLDEGDPRAMAAWARQMQAESGEDMGPEFEEMVGRLERGESIDDELGLSGHDHGDDADDDGGLP